MSAARSLVSTSMKQSIHEIQMQQHRIDNQIKLDNQRCHIARILVTMARDEKAAEEKAAEEKAAGKAAGKVAGGAAQAAEKAAGKAAGKVVGGAARAAEKAAGKGAAGAAQRKPALRKVMRRSLSMARQMPSGPIFRPKDSGTKRRSSDDEFKLKGEPPWLARKNYDDWCFTQTARLGALKLWSERNRRWRKMA